MLAQDASTRRVGHLRSQCFTLIHSNDVPSLPWLTCVTSGLRWTLRPWTDSFHAGQDVGRNEGGHCGEGYMGRGKGRGREVGGGERGV